MLAPKCATYNGRSTFANPKYLKIAQSEKPRLYEIPYDTSDPANRFCPNGEEDWKVIQLCYEPRPRSSRDRKAVSYDNLTPLPPRQNVVPSAEKTDSSQQG
ncbi:hypothetical protein Tco_0924304 [Tanacetum coccineum]|uniref:Uncharacterized protein n=1 Tax=Tanacetum coccineum TaxID=301880 RepID=A0ABQ5D3J5_9ASTR